MLVEQRKAAGVRCPCPVCGDVPVRRHCVVRAGAVAVCGACGTWYRVPRPTCDDLAGIYDCQYYDPWGIDHDEAISLSTKAATFLPMLRHMEVLRASRGGARRLLDVGAATGVLLLLARDRGYDPFAVELNPFAADLLRQRLGPDHVFEGELTACTFAPRSFDWITMTDLIEHVLHVGQTLSAAARLLRADGILCITTPRVDSLSHRLLGGNWLHFKREHIQYFTARGLRWALYRAGFERVQVSPHRKGLTYDYLSRQLHVYSHWALTPAVAGLGRLLPRSLRSRAVPYRCGEMLVTARPGHR
ncbi:MAG TPA: class I SAM-dependent methyltransferase [Phycisphaerae bacterium]|nr:class I SAM-dependent methyltransferase [Phycisphaerae bacterium]